MTEFKTWLEHKYIDWLSKRGKRGTIREFSELIGADQRLVANWMNGNKKPGPEMADKIATFLDYDMTVYELLDLPKPAKELLKIKTLWPKMTDKQRAEVGKLIEDIERSNAKEQTKRPIPNT